MFLLADKARTIDTGDAKALGEFLRECAKTLKGTGWAQDFTAFAEMAERNPERVLAAAARMLDELCSISLAE